MQRQAYNSLKTGFIPGILLPLVSLLVFYLYRYSDIPMVEFGRFIFFRDLLSPLISLIILPNLLLFFIFIRKDFLLSARGVLLATFFFAGLIMVLKVIS
jgi:hypothetical protein